MKTFEQLPDQSIYPVIDSKIKKNLSDKALDALWMHPTEVIRSDKDSFYVPAILSFFGWKAELTGEKAYNLVCTQN